MPHPFLRRGELVDRAASAFDTQQHAVSSSAVSRRAIDIAGGIGDNSSLRKFAVVGSLALKHAKDGFLPGLTLLGGRGQLINCAAVPHRGAVGCAAVGRGPVEVARLIKHHASGRRRTVTATLEAVKHFLFPPGRGGRSQNNNGHERCQPTGCESRVHCVSHGRKPAPGRDFGRVRRGTGNSAALRDFTPGGWYRPRSRRKPIRTAGCNRPLG